MPLTGEAKTQNAWSFPQLPISLPFKFKFTLCVCVFCLHVRLCTTCMPRIHGGSGSIGSHGVTDGCESMWVLIEFLSSGKTVSAFNCCF